MNDIIAEIFKGFLTGLNFVDKLGGLVQVMESVQMEESVRKYPVDYSLTQHQSDENNYEEYVPDEHKRSIIYFEDGGVQNVLHSSRYIDVTSTIKLVAWFNLERINTDLNNASTLIFLIMGAIPKSFANQNGILKARIEFDSQDDKTPAIFSPYEYDDSIMQYLKYPYDYGALNYNIIYSIKPDCIDQIELKPKECLTNTQCNA